MVRLLNMHLSLMFAAMLAPALAQIDSIPTLIAQITSADVVSTTSASVPTSSYSNFANQFLTQTNSLGVVTGMPSLPAGVSNLSTFTSQPAVVTSQPTVVTAQPAVATIPAALPSGLNTIHLGNASSFVVSVDTSTTIILAGTAAPSTPGPAQTGPTTIVSVINSGPNSGLATTITTTRSRTSGGATPTTDGSYNSDSQTTTAAPTSVNTGAAQVNDFDAVAAAVLGAGALIVAFI
ncbi:uncharacterized protein K489DRAFT_367385 [Dissoconium aciculare CBS 342.82]|uniref:GPI anchored protein n=1 Tax=Dissoconium aciculare CBS 342.82 TaxID=1314786 RepID=A0A6J3MDN9_9PEZI|nr:uncharacterized protein K489DRAFT_367385 [Dissoconium aciculare CBS 342.82]KAF1826131.1 hypothetical protein K489DRAFT_367385 [Dissoconium aciculare CBS 342.82]